MSLKPVIGILGGIGSGKSTVAQAFAELGCAVIDADALAHEVLTEPAVAELLITRWGQGVLDAAGKPDRAWIAERVFDSAEELEFLNGLVHPRVMERVEAQIQTLRTASKVLGIVLDVPLLMEVGWEKKCDFLVFVDCSDEKRRQRAVKNGKIDIEQIKKRENFQISLDKKKLKAHYMIRNSSDKSDIAEQVAQIFSKVMASSY